MVCQFVFVHPCHFRSVHLLLPHVCIRSKPASIVCNRYSMAFVGRGFRRRVAGPPAVVLTQTERVARSFLHLTKSLVVSEDSCQLKVLFSKGLRPAVGIFLVQMEP